MPERDLLDVNDKTADSGGPQKTDIPAGLVAEAQDIWSKTPESVDLTTVASIGASIIAGPLAGLATFAAARSTSADEKSQAKGIANSTAELAQPVIHSLNNTVPEKLSDGELQTVKNTPAPKVLDTASSDTHSSSTSSDSAQIRVARTVNTPNSVSTEQRKQDKPDQSDSVRGTDRIKQNKLIPASSPDKPNAVKLDRSVEAGSTDKSNASTQDTVQTDDEYFKSLATKEVKSVVSASNNSAEPAHLDIPPLKELTKSTSSDGGGDNTQTIHSSSNIETVVPPAVVSTAKPAGSAEHAVDMTIQPAHNAIPDTSGQTEGGAAKSLTPASQVADGGTTGVVKTVTSAIQVTDGGTTGVVKTVTSAIQVTEGGTPGAVKTITPAIQVTDGGTTGAVTANPHSVEVIQPGAVVVTQKKKDAVLPGIADRNNTGNLPEVVAATPKEYDTLSGVNQQHFAETQSSHSDVNPNKDTTQPKDSNPANAEVHGILGISFAPLQAERKTTSTIECLASESPNQATKAQNPVGVSGNTVEKPAGQPDNESLPLAQLRNNTDSTQRQLEPAVGKTDLTGTSGTTSVSVQRIVPDTIPALDGKQTPSGTIADPNGVVSTVLDKNVNAGFTDSIKGQPNVVTGQLTPGRIAGVEGVPVEHQTAANPPELIARLTSGVADKTSVPGMAAADQTTLAMGVKQAAASLVVAAGKDVVATTSASGGKVGQLLPGSMDQPNRSSVMAKTFNPADTNQSGRNSQAGPIVIRQGQFAAPADARLLPPGTQLERGQFPGAPAAWEAPNGLRSGGFAQYMLQRLTGDQLFVRNLAFQPAALPNELIRQWIPRYTTSGGNPLNPSTIETIRTLWGQRIAAGDLQPASPGPRPDFSANPFINRLDPSTKEVARVDPAYTQSTVRGGSSGGSSLAGDIPVNRTQPSTDRAEHGPGSKFHDGGKSSHDVSTARPGNKSSHDGLTSQPAGTSDGVKDIGHPVSSTTSARPDEISATTSGRLDIIDKGGSAGTDRGSGGKPGTTPDKQIVLDIIAGALGLGGIRRAGDDKPVKPAETQTQQQDNAISPDRRTRYIVRFGETLEQIAKLKLGDPRYANLILTINRSNVTFVTKDGKQIPVLEPGQALWLPSESELNFYKQFFFSTRPAWQPQPENKLPDTEGKGYYSELLFTPPKLCIVNDAAPDSPKAPSEEDSSPMALVLYRLRHAGGRGSISLNSNVPGKATPAAARLWVERLSSSTPEQERRRALDESGAPPPNTRCGGPTKAEVQSTAADPLGNCRVVSTTAGDMNFSTRLQASIAGSWTTIAAYESCGNEGYRYIYRRNGSRLSCRLDLPTSVIQDMAREDFRRNHRSYLSNFLKDDFSNRALIAAM